MIKTGFFKYITAFLIVITTLDSLAQVLPVQHDVQEKAVSFGNKYIQLKLDYNQKANISSLSVNGQVVIDAPAGIYSEVKTAASTFSTFRLLKAPALRVNKNTILLNGIMYGGKVTITETWKFTILPGDIVFSVDRTVSKRSVAEEIALPVFNFNHINTWEGAYQGYGGLAWFYLFKTAINYILLRNPTFQFLESRPQVIRRS